MTINRRNIVKGAAWGAPIVLASATIPAYAASRNGTAKTTAGKYYHTLKSATPAFCNVSTNPQTGYIDNLPYRSPKGNSNALRDPNSSNGYWVEGTAGTVTQVNIKTTYTFNHPIRLTGKPVLNGWSLVLSGDGKTLTATYSAPVWNVSTSASGSGDATGFLQEFAVTDGCFGDGVVKVTTSTVMTYRDANGLQTFTKTTTGTGI